MYVLWFGGMMSSSQGTLRSLRFVAPFSGITVCLGCPGDVGSASKLDAAHL